MHAHRSPAARVALVLLVATVLALPLARGGVDWPSQACAVALLLGAWAIAG